MRSQIGKMPLIQIGIMVLWCGYLYLQKTSDVSGYGKVAIGMAGCIPVFVLLYYGNFFFQICDQKRSFLIHGCICLIALLLVRAILLISQIGFSVSLGFLKDYVKSLFQHPQSAGLSALYSLCVIFLFAPVFSRLIPHLSDREKRAVLCVLGGYFLFFTAEIFGGFAIKMSDVFFHNIFGYLLGYQLFVSIQWTDLEKRILAVGFLLSVFLTFLFLRFYPSADQMNDMYFIFRMLMTLGCYHLLTLGRSERREINILPVMFLAVCLWEWQL